VKGEPPPSARDQGTSEFTAILERLVRDTPSARAAALFDFEGETVDYAGRMDPFDLRVVAAHCQILLAELRDLARHPAPRQLRIQARRAAYVVRVLDEHYSLLLVTHRRAAFAASERVLRDAEARIAREAGIDTLPSKTRWARVDVQIDRARAAPVLVRPALVAGRDAEAAWYAVDVLGALVGLPRREHGFRVRLDSGVEANLVAERARRGQRIWFVDEPLS
jgi:hypothetical protein